MDTIRTLGLSLLAWLADHPELTVALFTAVIWPALSAALSLAHRTIEARAPNVAALLASVGLDLPGARRALVALTRGWLARRGVIAPPPVPDLPAPADPEATPVTRDRGEP
jgi:hypothetical protein